MSNAIGALLTMAGVWLIGFQYIQSDPVLVIGSWLIVLGIGLALDARPLPERKPGGYSPIMRRSGDA